MTTVIIYSGDQSPHYLRRDIYKLIRDRGIDTKLNILSIYDIEENDDRCRTGLDEVNYFIVIDKLPTKSEYYYDPKRTLVFRNVLSNSNPEFVEANRMSEEQLDQTFGSYDIQKYMAVIDNCPFDYVVHKAEKQIKAKRCGLMLDGIMCITLEGKHDRQEIMRKEFEKYDLDVDFYVATPHPKNPKMGCLESHLAVLEHMKEKGWDNMLILEDDCFFARGFQIPTPPSDWEMLYLGSSVNTLLEKYNQDWNRVCTWLTHAYVVNYKIVDILIENIKKMGYAYNMTIDDLYCQIIHPKHRCYSVYPTIAIQREGYSNIERTKLNRLPQIKAADRVIDSHIKKPRWVGDVYYLESYEIGKYEKEAVRREFDKRNIEYRRMDNFEMILNDAKRRQLKNIMVFSGEVHINKSLYDLYYYPSDFDLLYLGDNTSLKELDAEVLETRKAGRNPAVRQELNRLWRKMDASSGMKDTFAFVIQSQYYDQLLSEYVNNDREYPTLGGYFAKKFHGQHQCYMSNEEYVQNKVILQDANEDKDKLLENDELPNISIITPTGNRERLFRMAIMNFLAMDYPREKIEWIIVDDGDEPMDQKFMPKDARIKYYYINQNTKDQIYKKAQQECKSKAVEAAGGRTKMKKDEKKLAKQHWEYFQHVHKDGKFNKNRLPIGLKRNMGVRYASNDVLVHMDDDDFYPIKSVKYRVSRLEMLRKVKPSIGCIGSTTIATFDINNYVSTINIPPMQLPLAKRVSEATMVFTRDFWNKGKFDSIVVASEGEFFIRDRESRFIELDYHEYENQLLVALHHRGNLTRTRRMENQQSNGWHFGEISEQLFQFITSLDVDENDNKDKEETENGDEKTETEGETKTDSETENGEKTETQTQESSASTQQTPVPELSQSNNLKDMIGNTISQEEIDGSLEKAQQILKEQKKSKTTVGDFFALTDEEKKIDVTKIRLE